MLRPARVAGEASCVKSSDGSVATRTKYLLLALVAHSFGAMAATAPS